MDVMHDVVDCRLLQVINIDDLKLSINYIANWIVPVAGVCQCFLTHCFGYVAGAHGEPLRRIQIRNLLDRKVSLARRAY